MSDYTVLWISEDELRRIIYRAISLLRVQIVAQTCVIEYGEEDGEWFDDDDPLELDRKSATLLMDLLDTFISTRPKQVHNNIEWCVNDGIVFLNNVSTYLLPGTGVDMRVAGELVSRLLTTNRTLNLFLNMPKLSDADAELWIAERIDDIAGGSEF